MLKLIGLFVVTAALDRLLAPHAAGVILADPVTVIAVAAVVTAATAVTEGTLNYISSQEAADLAKSQRNEQQSKLDAQARVAQQDAAAMAVSGQTFGKDDPAAKAAATGLGFGSGNAPAANGRAQLTGMGS